MLIPRVSQFLLAAVIAASLASTVLADNAAVVGTWSITIEDDYLGDSDLDITLIIEEDDDGELTGTWEGERGDDDLEDVEWDGETLSFVREVYIAGRDVDVEHTAEIDGDTMEGEIEFPRTEVEFSGEREEDDED